MGSLLSVARAVIIFVAGSGFLFGQLFFGRFEILDTIVGLSGVLAALLSFVGGTERKIIFYLTAGFASLSLLATAVHAFEYYASSSPNTGSYYPWFMTGPYLAALCVLIFFALKQSAEKTGVETN